MSEEKNGNQKDQEVFSFDQDELSSSINKETSADEQGEASNSLNKQDSSLKASPREKMPKLLTNEISESPIEGKRPSPRPFMVAASPPKFVSFEEIMEAANGVSNMALAHEIAVDNDFRFNKQELPENSLEKQVGDIMRLAFWDILQEKLNEDPPDYSHALVLLEEVKEKVEEILLPQHNRIRTQIKEVIDMELIKQKAEHEALNFQYYADFVTSIMGSLCSPARDEQIAKLKDIKEVVPLFKEIFKILDLMKMDMANFTIQQIRPYIQQQSVEYERTKFKEFLKKSEENNVDGLQFTRCWLERHGLELYYKSKAQVPSQEKVSSSTATKEGVLFTPSNIMNTAYLEVLQWPSNQEYPETMVMDEKRFHDLENKIKFLTLVSSILLVTYNTVGGAIAGIAGFKETLKEKISIILKDVPEKNLGEAIKNVSAEVDKDVCVCLSKHGYPTLDQSRREMLQGQIEGVLKIDHPVHKIMWTRVQSFIKDLISGKKPSEVQIPAGFSAVTEELKHICGQFIRLISHNRQVFGFYYSDIISTFLRKTENLEQEEGTPV